jgi:molybdopterin/thiamine biosynthesis adenylyltransferase
MLSKKELERYKRQLILEGFGEEAQKKLKDSKVALFGLGGLGSTASLYLVAAGVGNLLLFDPEKVEISNLNRQVLYQTKDVGREKAKLTREKLLSLNSEISISAYTERLQETVDIWKEAHLLIDCLDNLEGRLFLNNKATELQKPLISAAVEGWQGYLYTYIPRETPCLNCIFGNKSKRAEAFPVIGVTPGVLGLLEATEAIKYLAGKEVSTRERILLVNLETLTFKRVKVKKNPECEICS